MQNRLDLDFSLEKAEDRKVYLDNYLKKSHFKLSFDELEMCANYLLWGKDPDGKNTVQRKEIQIDTRNKTWCEQREKSLEELLESPHFDESQFLAPPKKPKLEVFSRKKALEVAPSHIKKELELLFTQIDETEALINFWEFFNGKRKAPPRDSLIANIDREKLTLLQEKATHLNQSQYLVLRHRLVELRRQQYSYKECYTTLHECINLVPLRPPVPADFGEEILVRPLGLKENSPASFRAFSDLVPSQLSDSDLKEVSQYYWKIQDECRSPGTRFIFDFCNLEHISQLVLSMEELFNESKRVDSQTSALLDTFFYYLTSADLTDIQREVVLQKIDNKKNKDIADSINERFGTKYSENYISTIFRQQALKKMTEAAQYHERLVRSLPFPELFKQCSTCGRSLLIEPRNFVRHRNTGDGFTKRCKKCDQKLRCTKGR